MKNFFLLILAFGVFAYFTTGCASIVKGRTQEVTFQSVPDGATVTVNGRVIGKTPITTTLQKKSGQTLVFEKEGYKTLTMNLETRMTGWFWGNIVLGGLVGSTTDGVTGAMNEYSPSQYMVALQAASSNPLDGNTQKPQSQKIKEFVVVGYNSLVTDIRKGSGEYLSSLLELLHIVEKNRDEAIKKIQALAEKNKNIPDFADQIISSFPDK